MYKKTFLLMILYLIIASGNIWSATILWTGHGADPNYLIYNDGANWNLGRFPIAGDVVQCGQNCPADVRYPVIIDSNHIGANKATGTRWNVGINCGAEAVMTGGQLELVQLWLARNASLPYIEGKFNLIDGEIHLTSPGIGMYIGDTDVGIGRGILNMSGGVINIDTASLTVGNRGGGKGTISITGGTINIGNILSMGTLNSKDNYIYLDGGTIVVTNGLDIIDGVIDITEGTLKIKQLYGNQIEALKNDKKIIAYGNTGNGYLVIEETPGEPNVTTVTATALGPNQARDPDPLSNSVDVPYNKILSWTPGDNVASTDGHEVYFSTNFNDVNDRNPSVKTVEDSNSHNPGTMLVGTTYYWAVDEVNGVNKWEGIVWNFTIIGGKATEPIPSDATASVPLYLHQVAWTASDCIDQDFYFGTSFEDVNSATIPTVAGIPSDTNTATIPISLASETIYYWRVDSDFGVAGIAKGDIWSFKTIYGLQICDDFEEDHDYLANGTEGTFWDGLIQGDGAAIAVTTTPDYNDGKLYIEGGNCWWQSNRTGVLLYKEVIGPFIASIEVTNYPGLYGPLISNTNLGLMARVPNVNDAGPGEDYLWCNIYPQSLDGNRGYICGWYNNGTVATHFGRMDNAGSGNACNRFLQIDYRGDGIFYLNHSPDGVTWYPLNEADERVADGALIEVNPTIKEDMAGLPLQVGPAFATFSAGIAYAEYDNFCLQRNLTTQAYAPQPSDGDGMDLMHPFLSWNKGDLATGHNLYFGTDFNSVNDGSGSSDPEWVDPTTIQQIPNSDRFKIDIGAIKTLVIGQSYFWRVDEVNSVNVWKGSVWSFTVLDYSVIDKFEKYVETGLPRAAITLRNTWIDGYYLVTFPSTLPLDATDGKSGSYVQLSNDTADGTTNPANISLGGAKSMKFYYDNDGTIAWLVDLYAYDPIYTYVAPKYSEAMAAVDDAARLSTSFDSLGLKRDWSSYKILRIPFYGDAANTVNSTDKLYVAISDGDGTLVVMEHPDNAALTKPWWQDCYIPLNAFVAKDPGLNLSDIARIYIGVGNRSTPATGGKGVIFFDDLQLLAYSICVPGTVKADFNNDCTVNSADLELMTELWLGKMPSGAGPIVKLDASGLPLGTLSSWSNTGSIGGVFNDFNSLNPTDNPKVETVEGLKAVTFDGNDLLKASFNAPSLITGNNSWTIIYTVLNHEIDTDEEVFSWSQRGTDGRAAAANYGTNYSIVHWGAAYNMGFDRGVPAAHQWHTIGITFNGSDETVVADGIVNATEAKVLDIWPDCPVTVGSGYTGNPYIEPITPGLYFSGSLAKLEMYNYSMTAGELALKMGTPINLKADTVIDFKDFAVLANKWLVGPVLLGD